MQYIFANIYYIDAHLLLFFLKYIYVFHLWVVSMFRK